MFRLGQAVKACRGGGSVALLAKEGEGEGGLEGKVKEWDVSNSRLDETVRIPVDKWPETIVLTAKGLRKEILHTELLDKVWAMAMAMAKLHQAVYLLCRSERPLDIFDRLNP